MEPPVYIEKSILEKKARRAMRWKNKKFTTTDYNSGDLAKLLLILKKIRKWKKIASSKTNRESKDFEAKDLKAADLFDLKKAIMKRSVANINSSFNESKEMLSNKFEDEDNLNGKSLQKNRSDLNIRGSSKELSKSNSLVSENNSYLNRLRRGNISKLEI